jgi:hypothetical protein
VLERTSEPYRENRIGGWTKLRNTKRILLLLLQRKKIKKGIRWKRHVVFEGREKHVSRVFVRNPERNRICRTKEVQGEYKNTS